MPRFTHLHTHSHYSLLDGLAKIEDLVNRAKSLGMDSLAVTDHGNLYGAIEFYQKAKKAGIKPILGVEAYLAPGSRFDRQTVSAVAGQSGERYYHLILLCQNETGWKNLLKLMTLANLEGFYYKPRIDKELLRKHSEGLIALSACLGGEIPSNLTAGRYEAAKAAAFEYQEIFGKDNFYIEIGRHPNIPEVGKIEADLIRLSRETGIPLAATQDIHYAKPEDAEFHDILLAVQTGNKLSDDDRLTLITDDFSMTSPEKMAEVFSDIPGAVENTAKIADRCNTTLELGKTLLPNFPVPDGENANSYLRKIIMEKLAERYEHPDEKVMERLEYELGVIEKTGFADYFLIVQDFINWAKDHGIVVGPGRGSAAGSLIAYVLHITDIDPIKYDLLFERFLNPERIQMPDIDVDFADRRRDEVLNYVRQKYGNDCVAQIITFGTMAARAAVRDAGRAMGLSYGLCDQIAKLIPPNLELAEAIEQTQELKEMYTTNPDAKKVLEAAKHLEGVCRHASVHACGVVISNKPLTDYLPLQRAPQDDNIIITQFEMGSIETIGLLKMDFLGLKNLTIIEETVRLIRDIHGVNIDISKLPLDDAKTFALLQKGDNTGVFQFESSGMRRYMRELKPSNLEDLIAMVALYRPGPIELIPSFINRKHGKEKITYLHPKLEPILKNTYGIGVYQEQMMRIARDLAGYSLAEADTLRKAIGKKIKELLDEQGEKLTAGMIKNGIDPRTAKAIWDLFPPFARYGFNRSHAACYALIGYQTAYLRAHYSIELMTGLLNADSSDIDRLSFLISETQKTGIKVLPPDINQSLATFIPEGQNIRFGLSAIKNVGEAIVEAIITEREKGGPFKDLTDLLVRVQHKDLNKKSLESLIKAGALDSMNIERNLALQNIDEILRFAQNARKSRELSHNSLFGAQSSFAIGTLKLQPATPAESREKLFWEKELLGLYVSDHPLTAHLPMLEAKGVKKINEAIAMRDGTLLIIGGVITTIKKINTKNGQPMIFAKVEDTQNTMEIIVFSDALAKNPTAWEENNIVMIKGKMSWRDSEPKMICEAVKVI